MQVGDKVRYFRHVRCICPERLAIVKSQEEGTMYEVGCVETITGVFLNFEELHASIVKQYGPTNDVIPPDNSTFPFIRLGEWGYGPAACFELVEVGEISNHKCTCPEINFAYNGIGCKCGGY